MDQAEPTRVSNVIVAIPTFNEEESIGAVIREIPREIVSRVIIADGGSTDATVQLAREAGADVIAAGKGYGRACLCGSPDRV